MRCSATRRAGVERVRRSERLIGCAAYDLPDIEQLSDEIINRSEAATRSAIRKLKGGTFAGEAGSTFPAARSSSQAAVHHRSRRRRDHGRFRRQLAADSIGINVVLNYTHAYSTFAVRSCLNPDLPNNTGSLAPIKVSAPKGSIVNCSYPAPVNARHVVGM